jgi:hypothetical protein
MDAKGSWKISPKFDGLVDAIVAVRKELIDSIKKRYPYSRNLKVRFCDVHASPKVCQLLSASKMWKDCEESKDDFEVRRTDKRPHSQKMVADFELFKLVEDTIIGDENVRLAMEFEVSNNEWESSFGNVELVSR